jgi:hypothetical protein
MVLNVIIHFPSHLANNLLTCYFPQNTLSLRKIFASEDSRFILRVVVKLVAVKGKIQKTLGQNLGRGLKWYGFRCSHGVCA